MVDNYFSSFHIETRQGETHVGTSALLENKHLHEGLPVLVLEHEKVSVEEVPPTSVDNLHAHIY